jgi:hypothetical protein
LCANPVVPPFVDPNAPFFYQDAGSLVAPFFYKDTANPNTDGSSISHELTFFVQPSLTETTIMQWIWWAVYPSAPQQIWSDPAVFNNINVIAQVPMAGAILINPGDPVYSVYPMQNAVDWVTSPGTAVSFGNAFIGKGGGLAVGNASTRGAVGSVSSAPNATIAGLVGGSATAGLSVVGTAGITRSQFHAIATA